MKTKSSRFDRLVARYYPAVYSFASRLTDNPREAIAPTRDAVRSSEKQLRNLRDQPAVATTLISAVIRAQHGLAIGAAAWESQCAFCLTMLWQNWRQYSAAALSYPLAD